MPCNVQVYAMAVDFDTKTLKNIQVEEHQAYKNRAIKMRLTGADPKHAG